MANEKLSNKSVKVIENFASSLSAKLGYTKEDDMTYMEEIKQQLSNAKDELKQNMEMMKKEVGKFTTKLGMKPSKKGDFAEEMKQFLMDSVEDLKAQGYSEEDALKEAISRFSEEDFSEIKKDCDNHYDQGGIQMKYEEAIGLFYAAFLFLGVGAGVWIGYVYQHMMLGGIIGFVLGLGCGLFSNAFVALMKK